jgi:hypothetical protein
MADINVWVVVDGIFNLATAYPDPAQPKDNFFSVSHLVATLRASTLPTFSVDTANRGFNWFYNGHQNTEPDPNATIASPNPFRFDAPNVDLSSYDEIWLIGYEGTNFSDDPSKLDFMSDNEVAAIARFMDAGGGVFATGDHDGLGSLMCGRIPRVRSMRKWFARQDNDSRIPSQAPRNWPGGSADRADTLYLGPGSPSVSVYRFDFQSDDIPQLLTLLEPGHPAIQGKAGPLGVFPDHMHEGEVMLPWAYGETLSFATTSGTELFTEYPAVGGHKEKPLILATVTVQGGHSTLVDDGMPCENANFSPAPDPTLYNKPPLNVLAAYDGHTVGVGRVITDSSFHHYLDLNLLGDPCSLNVSYQQGFNASPAGKAVLAELDAFYVNIATWLAQRQPIAAWVSSEAIRVSWPGAANAKSFDIIVIGDPGSTTNLHPVYKNVTSPYLVPIEAGIFLGDWQSQYQVVAHGNAGQSSSTWSNVLGPPIVNVTLDPPLVVGGSQNATGTVELANIFVPPQGLQIGLLAQLPGSQPQSFVTVPSKTTVLPGFSPSASFPIATSVVPAIEEVEIQAWCPGPAVFGTATLQLTRLNPPGTIIGVSVNPDNVNFGDETAVCTVQIAPPQPPQAVTVNLSSSQPNVAAVPASVTVPAGRTTKSFPITVAARPTRGRVATVWISASAGGGISECEFVVGSLRGTP